MTDPSKRDWVRERLLESPQRRKDRAARNKARLAAIKSGKVKKGDSSKDIDHKKALRSGGSTSLSNTRVRSASSNRADNGGKGGRPTKRKAIPASSKGLKR